MKTRKVQFQKLSRAGSGTFSVESTRILRTLFFAALFLLQPLRGDVAREMADAIKPATEGVPEVAVMRLRALLGKNLSTEEWRAGAEKLVEALLAANRPTEALSFLDETRLRGAEWTTFWRAQALAGVQRWNEALPLYNRVATDKHSPFRVEAIFGSAETLRASGHIDEAQQKLAFLFREKQWSTRARLRAAELYLEKRDAMNARRLLDEVQPSSTTERKIRRFLLGRLEMVQKHPDRALAIFQALLKKPEGASHALVVATLFEVANAHLQLNTPEAGDDVIEDFIEHHPMDADLALIFAKLDELYRVERKPARAELERWTREPEQPRRAFAQWYLARIEFRASRRDKALQLFHELRRSHPTTPAIAGALLELAQLELEDRHFDEALATLNDVRSLATERPLLDQISLLVAQVHYRAKRFEASAVAFEQIARAASDFGQISMFNASLGWLQLGDHARFLADYNEFEKAGGDEESRARLRLEEGLLQAAKRDNKAVNSLQSFVRDFPQSARVSEAWVALAELAFHSKPPRLDEAQKNLERAADLKPTAAAVEQAEYLTIWIEDARDPDGNKVIELGNRFLNNHGASTFAPDIRMKLAEANYRRQDFANAQTQFEILAHENPTGPLAEKALFFAAESAMSSMGQHSLDHAIVLLDQVVQLKGDLRWAARNEQAVIERRLGKPQDALLLYDEVLKNDAKPSEKREALCGKGDIYFDLAADDAKAYERALEAYEQLANDAKESGHWRNQALFKKGVCLEKKADRTSALNTFYQVLDGQTRRDRAAELFWFYKAGFNAARLLEDDARWNSAAVIYQKLIAAGGSRADEAKARLNRLRLEHFLWEE
ncbi:MAG: tetratricopeptide repeat protein [Verrucomicrobiota bacterium]|nr:tetratricopeptide repeat protein [Verrucomicrobiota bacterium]